MPKRVWEYWKGKKFLKEKFIRHINRCNPKIKLRLVAERNDGSKVELPISKYTIFELADFRYYDGQNFEKVRDDLSQFWREVEFVEHDIIHQGKVYGYNKKTKRWDKVLKEHYLYKKPEWRKVGSCQ